MSPPGPSPEHLRVATWNVNSLRARTPALGRFIRRTRPDVILLQETKASDVAPEAAGLFAELGYEIAHAGAGPYNGVAIASVHPISAIEASPDDR